MDVKITTVNDVAVQPYKKLMEVTKTPLEVFPSFNSVVRHKLTEEEFIEKVAKPMSQDVANLGIKSIPEMAIYLNKLFTEAGITKVENFGLQFNSQEIYFNYQKNLSAKIYQLSKIAKNYYGLPYNVAIYDLSDFKYNINYGESIVGTSDTTQDLFDPNTQEWFTFQNNKSCGRLEILDDGFNKNNSNFVAESPSKLYYATEYLLEFYEKNGYFPLDIYYAIINVAGLGDARFSILGYQFYPSKPVCQDIILDKTFYNIGDEIKIELRFDRELLSIDELSPEQMYKLIKDKKIALVYIEEDTEDTDNKPIFVFTHIDIKNYSNCDKRKVVYHHNEINAIVKTAITEIFEEKNIDIVINI